MKIGDRDVSVRLIVSCLLVSPVYIIGAICGFVYYAAWKGFLNGFYHIMSLEEARYNEILDESEGPKDPA
jgi:hypothetical protein